MSNFCRWNLSKIFRYQVGYVLFIYSFCVSLREVIYWFVGVFIYYFLHNVPNFFWFVLEFIFEMKVLQEDLLTSLMVHQVFALCCLYLFRFSDLNFLRIAWGSLMFLYSSVNHGLLCFRDIMVLGDGFICYVNDGVGKMYYGFFLICIWFWD